MLLYRVFPHLPTASIGDPGHPLYINPSQGRGRWDNPKLYRMAYLAASPEAAIGEAFGNLSRWTAPMLAYPMLQGAEKQLGVYHFDEEANPLLNLDDPQALVDRGIRPSEVVIRNRPRTQAYAAGAHSEGVWSGLSWWSYRRPQWTVVAVWSIAALTVAAIDAIPGHPALVGAARVLAKPRSGI